MKTTAANELVTIKSFQNEIEAEIAKGHLQSSGIKSFIFKDDCGGTRLDMQLTRGVDLKVRQIDFARASEAFESIITSDRKLEELKPGENKAAIYSILSWIFCFIGLLLFIISMSSGKALLLTGIVVLITGIIFGISSHKITKRLKKT